MLKEFESSLYVGETHKVIVKTRKVVETHKVVENRNVNGVETRSML